MPYLTSGWVGYFKRSAKQILDAALVFLGAKVPEMTDLGPSNPYVRNLEQFSDIHEQLGYYVDNAARETFVTQARLYRSLIDKAREHDYKVIGNRPYSTEVQFIIDNVYSGGIITIPANTTISNDDGSIVYTTLQDIDIDGSIRSGIVSAVQIEQRTGVASVTSTGAADLEVVFTEKIAHDSLVVRWNTIAWQPKETLAFSKSTDTHFVQTIDRTGNVLVYFGNANPTGKIPVNGELMEVDYQMTLGAAGKVGVGELTKVVTTTAVMPVGIHLIGVTNVSQAVGGADAESIPELKRHIPIANRTRGKAVTEQDFKAVTELAPNVASAGVIFNGRRDIDIYIVPVGGGIASPSIIANTQAFIDARKVYSTHPVVHAAGEVHLLIGMSIAAKPGYSNSAVAAAAKQAILDFMNSTYQRIKGSVHQSDTYEKVETTEGVENSEITKFTIVPYARPISVGAPTLLWTRAMTSNNEVTTLWKITFTNSTTFKLIQGNTIIGTYSVSSPVTIPQMQFTVNTAGYSAGNTYEFYTYPYNATKIDLAEISLPVSVSSDIVLNVTGGY